MPDWNAVLFGAPATPRASTSATGWETGLDPTLADKARQLEALAAEEGIPVRITTGYRSPAEQARLYAQGRSAPGPIVTNARPGQSRHQHGSAIDVVPLKDGQSDWNSPHWDRLGALGEGLGLRWGGRFTRLKDRPHFELPTSPTAALPAARPRAAGAPRDWGQELFPTPTRTPTPPDRSAVVQHLVREARRQGVDPDLAVAVATQESSLDPGKVGDRGKSLGLFQLQEAAAIDAGIDPRRRGEIGENIRGGVRYLKLQLDREDGNVERALSRYNRGTPTYRGIGDPDYVENVMRHYQGTPGGSGRLPRVATPAQQPPAPREWGALLGFEAAAPQPAYAAAGDWGTAKARERARDAPEQAGSPVDWGAELGLAGSSRAPEAPAAVQPAPAARTVTPRAWGQELGLAQGAVPEASNAPAAPARAWAALLFG